MTYWNNLNQRRNFKIIAFIDFGKDVNCIKKGIIPTQYYEKVIGKITSANGEKWIFNTNHLRYVRIQYVIILSLY